MMMSLDTFIFQIGTLPYQQARQRWQWNFAKTDRFMARADKQFTGIGEQYLTLSGVLYPGQIGDYSSLARIRAMADAGEAYTLVTGLGEVWGQFTIMGLETTGELFTLDGVPRKADFSIDLDRSA